MNRLDQITDDAAQTQRLLLPDGSVATLSMEFKPMQYGWFITSLVYAPVTSSYGVPSNYDGPFEIRGFRIFVSPNILQQYRNQIPFGLACYSAGEREPTQQQDFSSGAAQLYLLNQADVAQITSLINGQAQP